MGQGRKRAGAKARARTGGEGAGEATARETAGREDVVEREGVRGQLSLPRFAGYALYDAWLLSSFYNTFLYMRTPDFRRALYFTTLVSLVFLALTIAAFPRVMGRRADKWVLSLRSCAGAGAGLAAGTLLTVVADGSTPAGMAMLVASAALTGICSGMLFLGWARLYADAGTRAALTETGLAWAAAGLACVGLSVIPAPVACGVVAVAGAGSAVLLRRCSFTRPARPTPAHAHQLRRRTRILFARGLAACLGVGLVAGFSDVLAGYRYLPVPDSYEKLLALSCTVVALLMAATAVASRHDFVTFAYREVTLLLLAGCLLTPLAEETDTLSNVMVFGAYISFTILLCVVCIDVSNYFDQGATAVFGAAFFCLYAGEIAGNAVAHCLGGVMTRTPETLSVITLVLALGIALANLFLFTEKDLTETSLGEMTDDDTPVAEGGTWVALTSEGPSWIAGSAGGALAGPWTPVEAAQRGADEAGRRERCLACDKAASCPQAAPEASGRSLAGARRRSVEGIVDLMSERFGLTPRERDVLPLVLQGRTIARIQEELHISQGTVSTHTRHIYQKAGVHNRQGLLDLIDELAGSQDERP